MNSRKKPEVVAIFDRCPNCGSERRFAKSVADEQKEKGVFRQEMPFGLFVMGGPVADPGRKILVGQSVPVVNVVVDACLDCGCIYAVQMTRQKATLKAVPPGQLPPGMPTMFGSS